MSEITVHASGSMECKTRRGQVHPRLQPWLNPVPPEGKDQYTSVINEVSGHAFIKKQLDDEEDGMIEKKCIGITIALLIFCAVPVIAAAATGDQLPGSIWVPAHNDSFYPPAGASAVNFHNQTWVIGGNEPGSGVWTGKTSVWSSPDGETWSEVTKSAAFPPRLFQTSVVYDDKMWLIGGIADGENYLNDTWYSTDGITWTQATASATFPARAGHSSVIYDNKMWVIGGSDSYGHDLNDTWYSTDGITWIQATQSAAFAARNLQSSVVYDNKMWVISGETGGMINYYAAATLPDAWFSTDGINWSPATQSAEFGVQGLAKCGVFDNKLWAVTSTDAWNSENGSAWTDVSPDAFTFRQNPILTPSPDGTLFMILGGYDEGSDHVPINELISSSDGITWTSGKSIFSRREGHSSVVFNGKFWVIGGGYNGDLKNDVWSSTDGTTWTMVNESAGFSPRIYHTSVVYDNKMWVIGGTDGSNFMNDVWYSSDGVIWTQATGSAAFPARYEYTSLVFDNKMWVIGGIGNGFLNDVWYSADGVIWTQATGSAAFPARYGHSSVVYNNKMWVIGGESDTLMHDAWYSADGITWLSATNSAAFSPREGHSSVVFNNQMWVIGGTDDHYNFFNDVWYSMDGATWIQANASAPFAPRSNHASVVSPDGSRMLVIGGLSNSPIYGAKNDIWYSEVKVSPLIAGFMPSINNGTAPLSVQFTDLSVAGDYPITGYFWDFGDGANSTLQSPNHTFTRLGGNFVTETVTDSASATSSWNATITALPVPVPPPAPQAYFLMDNQNGNAPLSVAFTDRSTGVITHWAWNFGDGQWSNERNPVHTYQETTYSTAYTPSLTVTDELGRVSTYTAPQGSVYAAKQDSRAAIADFIATITSGPPAASSVQVADRSQRASDLIYDFSDGSTSIWPNTNHIYSKPALYRITQTVSNQFGGTRKSANVDFGTDLASAPPSFLVGAAFAADYYSGDAPLTVHFYDRSWGDIKKYYWQFGDGTTSTDENPIHTYTTVEYGLHNFPTQLTVVDEYGAVSTYSTNIGVWGQPHPTPTPTPTTIATTITPTGTFTIAPTPTGSSGTQLFVSESGVMYNGAIGVDPDMSQAYTVYLRVHNPTNIPIPATITMQEKTVHEGYKEEHPVKDIVSPDSNIPIPAGGDHTYYFVYAHKWAWTTAGTGQIADKVIEGSDKIGDICSLIGDFVEFFSKMGEDPAMDLFGKWAGAFGSFINEFQISTSIINGLYGYSTPSEYSYTPVATNIDRLTPIDVKINVGAPKTSAFAAAAIGNCISSSLSIAGVASSWSGIGLTLVIGEAVVSVEQSTLNQIANDPDYNYTAPVVIDPLVIPELDEMNDTPVKNYVEKMIPEVDHSQGLLKSYAKYLGAQQARDHVWETKLLKESYDYSSLLINDFDSLNDSAGPAIKYLDENGFHPTEADVENAKNSIRTNGLPEVEIALLKRWNFTDDDISAVKNQTLIAPDYLVTEYNQSWIYLINLQKEQIIKMNQQFATDLGDNAPPYADFNVSTTSGEAPLSVEFTDASLRNATQFTWDFGDNTTITTQNPDVFYTYYQPGNYTVTLTASSYTGTDTRTKYELITVAPGTPPAANFTAFPTSGLVPLTVQFNDTSVNGSSWWKWDFGDGTNSTDQNPIHVYQSPGTYNITLFAFNLVGWGWMEKDNYITVSVLPPVANFTAAPKTGNAPLLVTFTDTSQNNATSWSWNFGDGNQTNSSVKNPLHTYLAAGNYTVSLNVTNAGGSNSSVKTGYINITQAIQPGSLTLSPVTDNTLVGYIPPLGDSSLNDLFTGDAYLIYNEETWDDARLNTGIDTSTGNFSSLYRSAWTFNTSSIPAGATIRQANLSLYLNMKYEDMGDTEYQITTFFPNSSRSYTEGDWQHFGDQVLVSFPGGNWRQGGTLNFTLPSSAINKGGDTMLAGRLKWDVNRSFTGTWDTGMTTMYRVNSVRARNHRPVLYISYN